MPRLESGFDAILTELQQIPESHFVDSPDSLTTVRPPYDERGWKSFALLGDAPECEANARRCRRTARACSEIPGVVNASFSLFRPGTHLYPHKGEIARVLRCHLPLVVPAGELGIRAGSELRRWERGRCLVLDDTFEHEAWNHGDGSRVLLIATFALP